MDKHDYIIIGLLAIVAVLAFYLGYFMGQVKERNSKVDEDYEIMQLPKCRCSDVNECSTWCQAKERFKRYH